MLIKHQKGGGKSSFFHLIVIIIIIIQCIQSGCLEKESKSNELNNQQPKKISLDNPLILPNWTEGQYHNYAKTTQFIHDYNEEYPDLIDVFSIGKSVEDRDIWCVKITNENNDSLKNICVIDGCIHGNEWEACEIVLYLAEYLLINFGKNNSVNDILNSSVIYLIPLLNPDGRENDERYNENGIDLNRNFDVHFGRIRGNNYPLGKLFGFIKIPYIHFPRKDQIYTNCGRKPFCEPETAAFYDFMHSLNKISFYVNCHTAMHAILPVYEIEHEPEYKISIHEKNILRSSLNWIKKNTQYAIVDPDYINPYGFGIVHHWVFKEFHIPSFCFEVYSQKYDPGYIGGGPHNNLVYWMKESLPVLLFFLVNIDPLNDWDFPDNEPVLPER